MPTPTPRNLEGMLAEIRQHLTLLERRSGKTVLPARLQPVVPQVTDANLAVETGTVWLPSGAANAPRPGNWQIETVAYSNGQMYQTAKIIGSGTGTNYREEWTRWRGSGGGWGTWSLLNQNSTTFAPVIQTGFTMGNATVSGRYEITEGYLRGRAVVTLGSTSAMLNSDFIMAYPVPVSNSLGVTNFDGAGRMVVGGGNYDAAIIMNSTGIYVRAKRHGNAGAPDFVAQHTITTSTPETWAAGDRIEIAFGYPIQP